MKKSFFFATMLLSIATTAQQRTFVKSVGANYAAKQVTFNISWAAGSRGTVGANTYNSKVWVLVDYQEVQNGVAVGNWKRADIVLSSLPAGCTAGGTNTKGFWYQGQTSAAQNASITVTLSGVPAQFNWCAFASDCPPRVIASSNGSYTFAGTPPFILTAVNGATQQVNGTTLAHSALTIAPTLLTDQTNCPGIFCPYTGTDLFIDATHICQLRTSGAKNWEAWIKDTRDSKPYRIVYMPDHNWWLAQNVKLASYNGTVAGTASSGCTEEDCGRIYSYNETIGNWGGTHGSGTNVQGVCPPGWRLVNSDVWVAFVNAIAPTTFTNYTVSNWLTGRAVNNTGVAKMLQAHTSECGNGNDYYGWAAKRKIVITRAGIEGMIGVSTYNWSFYYFVNHQMGTNNDCNYLAASYYSSDVLKLPVRCFRTL